MSQQPATSTYRFAQPDSVLCVLCVPKLIASDALRASLPDAVNTSARLAEHAGKEEYRILCSERLWNQLPNATRRSISLADAMLLERTDQDLAAGIPISLERWSITGSEDDVRIVGRDAEISKIKEILMSRCQAFSWKGKRRGHGRPGILSIMGRQGSGKTAMLSYVYQHIIPSISSNLTILRYCVVMDRGEFHLCQQLLQGILVLHGVSNASQLCVLEVRHLLCFDMSAWMHDVGR